VLPLGGGDKTTWSGDIATARQLWLEYKRRKSENLKKSKEPAAKKSQGQFEARKSEEENRCP